MSAGKQMLQALLPPLLWNIGQRALSRRADRFDYAPPHVVSKLAAEANEHYWTEFLARERDVFLGLRERVTSGEKLLPDHDERLKYYVYGYVLALASREQPRVAVLDYGGNLGDYYWIGNALVPGVALDYHVKELPAFAIAGQELTPEITWHTDDRCLDHSYDLVMFSSSMQYASLETIRRAAVAARRYLLLSDVPAVTGASFFSTHRTLNVTTVQRHPNLAEILALIEPSGMKLIREFAMGPHPPVAKAPEQPVCVGWLFERA